jgi:cytochrome c oxidase subunit 2
VARHRGLPCAALLAAAGCAGPQSALDPAGTQAAVLAQLWWWLAAGAVLVWAAVMVIAWWVSRRRPDPTPSHVGAAVGREPAFGDAADDSHARSVRSRPTAAPTRDSAAPSSAAQDGAAPLPAVPRDARDAATPSSAVPRAAHRLILIGGVLVPVVVLTALLGYGLWLMPTLRPALPETALTIEVSGEQWWWRVRYPLPDGGSVELANEVWLPVGEPVAFELSSPDVIHSFWIPALGGKMDMIPGRTNRLVLEATRPGRFRGACAEYCGSAHALMAFAVVAAPRDQFEQWLAGQARPAAPPQGALAARGARAFLAQGCGACHTVRGTPANGVMGPDLTHVGSRLSLGAGMLPAEPEAFARFVGHTGTLKPGVRMPSFAMLPEDELAAIAAWLEQLQ